jgi:hypothetical protein
MFSSDPGAGTTLVGTSLSTFSPDIVLFTVPAKNFQENLFFARAFDADFSSSLWTNGEFKTLLNVQGEGKCWSLHGRWAKKL